jgi:hypothetical protein
MRDIYVLTRKRQLRGLLLGVARDTDARFGRRWEHASGNFPDGRPWIVAGRMAWLPIRPGLAVGVARFAVDPVAMDIYAAAQ